MKKNSSTAVRTRKKGLVLRSLDDSPSLFRVYNSRRSFKDYKITHHDLAVQILDDSAEFLESMDGEKFYLDYSRKVLGQNKKYKSAKKT